MNEEILAKLEAIRSEVSHKGNLITWILLLWIIHCLKGC